MKTTLAIAAAMAAVTLAHAQEAVQWRVEDGGNGHWYAVFALDSGVSWTTSRQQANAIGGHLATITSQAENDFVFPFTTIAWSSNAVNGPWLGGFQDISASDYAEPNGGWRWITGEVWNYAPWDCINPDDDGAYGINETQLHYSFSASCGPGPAPFFNDSIPQLKPGYVVEWSADCNSDGIVDYGQILDGTLVDCDGNTIPDSCDTSFADCNANGVPDPCDIADGRLADCNGNLIADECEATIRPDLDCDGDGHLDECQIADDPALDVNGDGILDACTIAIGDFTLDGVVNGGDLAVLLSVWGSDDADIGDLTGDGLIDGEDLTHLLGNWGAYQGGWYTILELLPPPEVIVDVEVRSRIAATGLPWRIRDIGSGIEMLLVPPGTFMMGCSPSNQFGCDADENPVHEVTLTQAFYLGRYEVTQAQWATVMNNNPSHFQTPSAEVPADQVPRRPVEKTSWTMIQDFEAATGLRLPTEAEWEYACRAGTQTAFNLPPNGTNDDGLLAQLAWFGQQGGFQTHPVGQKQANKLGLHDMHGNVQEWCEDWYDHAYYATSPTDDPPGPSRGVARVVRGGYWYYGSSNCRSSHRTPTSPSYASSFFGFRAARTP